MAYNEAKLTMRTVLDTERLLSAHKKLLRYAQKFRDKECAYTLRYPDMLLDERIIVGDESVSIPDRPYPYIGIHNHPTNTIFSHTDLLKFTKRDNMRGLTAVGNGGSVYGVFKVEGYDKARAQDLLTRAQAKLNDFVVAKDAEDYLKYMNSILKEAAKYGIYFDSSDSKGN